MRVSTAQALTMPCPHCGARAGVRCRELAGPRPKTAHTARARLYVTRDSESRGYPCPKLDRVGSLIRQLGDRELLPSERQTAMRQALAALESLRPDLCPPPRPGVVPTRDWSPVPVRLRVLRILLARATVQYRRRPPVDVSRSHLFRLGTRIALLPDGPGEYVCSVPAWLAETHSWAALCAVS